MPLIDLVNQAETTCKHYPEKDDKSTFDSLRININNPAAAISKLQSEVAELRVKKKYCCYPIASNCGR